MRSALLVAACLFASALAAPTLTDLSGHYETSGSCVTSGVISHNFMVVRQCGANILVSGVTREYALAGNMLPGTVDVNGVVTVPVTINGQSATCTVSGTQGSLAGSCSIAGQSSCAFNLECVDGTCLTGAPVPAPGTANGAFADVAGTWSTVGGTCSDVPRFSKTFDIEQCGYSLLVLPSSQGPNTGAINRSGHLLVGTQPGSTTQCEGNLISTSSINATCYYDGVPMCYILLNH